MGVNPRFKGEDGVERGPGHKPLGRSSTNSVGAGFRRLTFVPWYSTETYSGSSQTRRELPSNWFLEDLLGGLHFSSQHRHYAFPVPVITPSSRLRD